MPFSNGGLLPIKISLSGFGCQTISILQSYIDGFNYRAWPFVTSFIDHAIQIYVGQKATENQWRVMVLEELLHTALLYQANNTRNINVLAVLKQYLVLITKEQWGDFSVQLDFVSV